MTYTEARNYIEFLKMSGISPGLTNITKLCEKLDNPQNKIPVIHIAGTNGKGSVGAFISKILQNAGYSVGRFVSPAVETYLEMFTINGNPVSENRYAHAVEQVKSAADALSAEGIFPTAFEAETAIAFLLFTDIKPRFVLIECGMGGALDSTNVISSPLLSIITSVSKDHSSFLGDTIEKIAVQKCGIIKNSIPVVTCGQSPEVAAVISDFAKCNNSELCVADDISDTIFCENGTDFLFENEPYHISMNGSYQVQNAAVAVKACKLLHIDDKYIKSGLNDAHWNYRFEKTGKFILDGAHNEDAAKQLANSIKTYNLEDTAFVCGCFRDKEYDKIAQITTPYASVVYCVKPPTERGLDPNILACSFCNAGADAYPCTTLEEALERSAKHTSVVVFGSLSILSDAKKIIERNNPNAKMQ